MASEQLMHGGGHRYFPMQSEASLMTMPSLWQGSGEPTRMFDELPKATIVSVSRPDVSDISPMLLSYTIECQYKQFKWCLHKKASQVFYLHFALKKRAFIEEIHEKQEQVKEWLQNLGIGDHAPMVQDEDDDETILLHHDESAKNRSLFCPEMFPQEQPCQSFVLHLVGSTLFQIEQRMQCKNI